jgi:ACR3 family arsenite efflux pump ArsB
MMKKIQEHLNKWMLLYVVLAIGLGLLVGSLGAAWTQSNSGFISAITTAMVFFVIYPMMVNLKFESLIKAGKNVKGLSLAMIYNFIWTPLMGFALARLFLHDPLIALGFLLVMVVPCSSMAVGYTGLSGANVELATVSVALSFVIAVFTVPFWMTVFASHYAVPVPVQEMVTTILTVLIAPMILGYFTRRGLVRWFGEDKFKKLQPFFPSLSLLSMFGIIFLIFFGKATMILDKYDVVLLLLVPSALYVILSLALQTWLNRKLGLSYQDHMAVAFASASSNNSTAIAIATLAFTPLVAVPAATMPIIQTLLMVSYLKLAPRVLHYFNERAANAVLNSEFTKSIPDTRKNA